MPAQSFSFSRSFKTKVQPTPNVVDCASLFGIGIDEDIEVVLYNNLEVKVGQGRVVYITGDSGAGKSCLMRDIADRLRKDEGFDVIDDVTSVVDQDVPLIDQFGDMELTEIGALLAHVGIAEAFVYIRKPRELSDGQRYRFRLAKMIHQAQRSGKTAIVFADEFLAVLDRETAKNVAYQTRRAATKFGLCFVVATTHEDIREDLQPDQSITMRLNLPVDSKTKP